MTYDPVAVGLDPEALDGPFLGKDGTFCLLLSLRGNDGGTMPSAGEVGWTRTLPSAAKGPLSVFVRQDARVLYLGTATRAGKGVFTLATPIEPSLWSALVATANRPLPAPPEEAIVGLGTTSTTDERIAAMRVFLERWFGLPDAPPLATGGPRALRTLRGIAGASEVCAQNRLVEPVLEEGKLVFYVENQHVCSWATEPEGDDPPVYTRQNDFRAKWEREAASLSEFLLQMLLVEAVFGAPFYASDVAIADPKPVLRRLRPLPLAAWESTGTRFHAASGVIAFTQPNGDGVDVWLGVRERERFEPLAKIVRDWEVVGF